MKVYSKILMMAAIPAVFACNNANKNSGNTDSLNTEGTESSATSTTSYLNLNTGEPATIIRDTETDSYVYADTRKPIEADLIFVDVNTTDTLYGPSGIIVNDALLQTDNSWKLDETKIERDGDEIKIKTPYGKTKIDGDDMKVKEGDSKLKIDDGEESKLKSSDSKTKIEEDGETKVKPE